MMHKFKIFVLTLVINSELSHAYCLYGDRSECSFQCHCAVASECGDTTSECPSGCANGPLGFNWKGPGCQIGNIGFNKSAKSTGFNKSYPPGSALDGKNPGHITKHECAHPWNSRGKAADWWTDLGGLYRIFDITVFGRTDCCQDRLQQFELSVYNTTDNMVLCGYHGPVINISATIECTEPRVGRFVHFIRTGGPQLQFSTLCEVVIIGHKIIDCSNCPMSVECNEVTGCTQCPGSYQPDCLIECVTGSYGINCAQRCGRCKYDMKCDKVDGFCKKGCEHGYYGEKCVDACSNNCMTNECSQEGFCTEGCKPGYHGKKCELLQV